MDTGETVEAPFTPETFTETMAVNWARQTVVGMSHDTLQYGSTANYKLDGMSFYFRALTQQEAERIHDARRFFLSLAYASANADSVRNGAPPRVLFIWPQVIAMTFVVSGGLKITHEKFNREGLTTIFRLEIPMEEIRDVRLSSEDVRANGTIRSGSAPEE